MSIGMHFFLNFHLRFGSNHRYGQNLRLVTLHSQAFFFLIKRQKTSKNDLLGEKLH